MFGLDWSELAIIGVIALVVVGPKDLPKLMRSAGRMAAQARRMADEFRGQMSEAIRDAELDDLRKSVDEIRALDPRGMIRDEVTKLTEPVRTIADDVKSELSAAQSHISAGLDPVPAADVPVIPDASPIMTAPVAPVTSAAIDLVLPELPPFVAPPEIPPAEPAPVTLAAAPLDLNPAPQPVATGAAAAAETRT